MRTSLHMINVHPRVQEPRYVAFQTLIFFMFYFISVLLALFPCGAIIYTELFFNDILPDTV